MTWNHRVIFHREKRAGESYFAVHECFYGKLGAAIPHSWTEKPIAPLESNMDALKVTLFRMRKACTQPILEIKGKKLIEYRNK